MDESIAALIDADVQSFVDVDEPNHLTDPTKPAQPPQVRSYLHPSHWGSFCYQIALHDPDFETPCRVFGVDMQLAQKLLSTPAFVAQLKEARKDVSNIADNTGFKLNARSTIEKHIKTLNEIANNANNDPTARIKAVEVLAKFAQVDAASMKAELAQLEANKQRGGTAVIFNFGAGVGLPTMVVASPNPISTPTTLDALPEQ